MGKVKHIVMFGVKADTWEEQLSKVKAGLLELPKKIEQIKDYELGIDLKLEGGQNHPAGKNRSVSWTATFDSANDYETYAKHEDHVACIKECIAPIIEPG